MVNSISTRRSICLGTDSAHWDMPSRDEKMSKIVAGMGVAGFPLRLVHITAALQKRVAFLNWGYNMIDGDLFSGNAGGSDFIKGIIAWNRKRYGITNIDPVPAGHHGGRHSRRDGPAGLRAYKQQSG